MRAALASLSLATLLAPALAQLSDQDQLVGWTNAPLLPSSGSIDVQAPDSCPPARRLCGGVLLHNGVVWAGGTAYDVRHQAVWVSDGRAMEERRLADCKAVCRVQPAIMRRGAQVTGLAIADARGFLYHLESTPGYLGILPWNNTKCPPVPTKGGCTMQLGARDVAGGLAYDEARDLLYFTVSSPAVVGWTSTLYVAQAMGNRCQPVCKFPLPACPSTTRPAGPITGLAYDACRRRLYATDGLSTRALEVVDPLKCTIKVLGCCDKRLGSAWGGLAFVAGWKSRQVGKACLPKTCPPCTSMRGQLVGGDPALGNRDFGFMITNGPAERFAFVALGGGLCTGGIQVPVLCGPFHPRLDALLLLPPVKIQGKGTCQGTAVTPLPLPSAASLCGLMLCAQWVVFCNDLLGATEAIEFALVSG